MIKLRIVFGLIQKISLVSTNLFKLYLSSFGCKTQIKRQVTPTEFSRSNRLSVGNHYRILNRFLSLCLNTLKLLRVHRVLKLKEKNLTELFKSKIFFLMFIQKLC